MKKQDKLKSWKASNKCKEKQILNYEETVTLIIVSAMALSLAACGSNKEADETVTTKDVRTEAQADKEEDTAKEYEAGTATKDEEYTTGKPSGEFVEPTAEEFEYNYDAVIGGVKITGYNGEARAIRIPAELDGDPVREVSLRNKTITRIEFPDNATSIGVGGCSSLTEITHNYANDLDGWWQY